MPDSIDRHLFLGEQPQGRFQSHAAQKITSSIRNGTDALRSKEGCAVRAILSRSEGRGLSRYSVNIAGGFSAQFHPLPGLIGGHGRIHKLQTTHAIVQLRAVIQ